MKKQILFLAAAMLLALAAKAQTPDTAYTIRTISDRIVVEGLHNETVSLLDSKGRCLQTIHATNSCTLQVPDQGEYNVQIGNQPPQKVDVVWRVLPDSAHPGASSPNHLRFTSHL